MKVGTIVKTVGISIVGLVIGLIVINWGRKNDIPGLKEAAEALDN